MVVLTASLLQVHNKMVICTTLDWVLKKIHEFTGFGTYMKKLMPITQRVEFFPLTNPHN